MSNNTTIRQLFDFQIAYLFKLLDNIPNECFYDLQDQGYNSPGWILGHLCVECEDVFKALDHPFEEVDSRWKTWFCHGTDGFERQEELPPKEVLIDVLNERYNQLMFIYERLTSVQRAKPHPSNFLSSAYTDFDAWFAHHLLTHVAIHAGNISVWKKIKGIAVEGY